MKEMCRNFVCNGCAAKQNGSMCQNNRMNQNGCMQRNRSMQQNNNGVQPAALQPDTMMGDCNACVMERIGLAQAFVPSQPFSQPMEQEQSLVCGTVFSDLVMPYCSGWNIYRFGREA